MNAKIETFFCNGKMFDRKMFLIINNDKYNYIEFQQYMQYV